MNIPSILFPFKALQAWFDWKKAKKHPHTSLAHFLDLNTVAIGCSFRPEVLDSEQISKSDQVKMLRYLIQDLGIQRIRLGIRWNTVTSTDRDITLEYYHPFLQVLEDYDECEVVLNTGPIKVLNWPEIHLPEAIITKYGIDRRAQIQPDSSLARLALAYHRRLLKKLKEVYPKLFNKAIIQIENEAFNPFGTLEWTASKQYLQKVVDGVRAIAPKNKILLNSSGLFDFHELIPFARLQPFGTLLLGIDYYYTHDSLYKALWTRVFDHLTFAPFLFSPSRIAQLSKTYGFEIEITEAQFEPWGRAVHPGASTKELRYVLYRCSRFVNKGTKLNISLWGLERIVVRFWREQKVEDQDILNIIQFINKRK